MMNDHQAAIPNPKLESLKFLVAAGIPRERIRLCLELLFTDTPLLNGSLEVLSFA
jgi:hypothetical protein